MQNQPLLIAAGIIIGALASGPALCAELGAGAIPGSASNTGSSGSSETFTRNNASRTGSSALTGSQGGGTFPGGGGSPIPVTPIPGHIIQAQVQTSYDSGISANGVENPQVDVSPTQYNTGPANIPQILGPAQTNYNHPNATELVTQTRVIFSGGQAVKVTQPLVTEYNWSQSEQGVASRSGSSYARVIKHEKKKKQGVP